MGMVLKVSLVNEIEISNTCQNEEKVTSDNEAAGENSMKHQLSE